MIASDVVKLIYIAYWVFFAVVVWRLEKRIKGLENDLEESEKQVEKYRDILARNQKNSVSKNG